MLRFTRVMELIAALVFTAGVALAQGRQPEFDFGKYEYEKHCAACHGPNGKGDGVQKQYLHEKPSDLTTLSKRNGGEFPFERVYEKIDGALEVEHASREMPCWGAEYRAEAAAAYAEEAGRDVSYSTELYVETRFVALVNHLRNLQDARGSTPVVVVTQDFVRGHVAMSTCVDASSSFHIGGRPLSFKWDFGDGRGTATTASACHEYRDPGLYAASVTVTDDRGVTESRTVIVSISPMTSPGV